MSNKGLVIKQNVENIATAIRGKQGLLGFNLWDEEWENGYYDETTGEKVTSQYYVRNKNFIKVKPSSTLYLPYAAMREYGIGGSVSFKIFYYDDNKNFISMLGTYTNWTVDRWIVTLPNNCHYINFYVNGYGTIYNNDLCVNYSDPDVNGQYEPYCKYKIGEMDEEINKLPSIPAVSNLNVVNTTQESTALTITDAKEAQINKIDVLGRTEQTGTPSPDSPSPIENVRGRNLFDGTFPNTSPYLVTNEFVGNNLYFTLTEKDDTVDISGIYLLATYQERYPFSNQIDIILNGEVLSSRKSFNMLGRNHLAIYPNTQETIDKLNSRFNIQIEEGTESTPYTPYNTINFSVEGKNLAYTGWAENFVTRVNNSSLTKIEIKDQKNCLFYAPSAGYGDYDNKYIFKTNWKENTQYTFSFNILNETHTSTNNLQIFYTDGSSLSFGSVSTANNWEHKYFTSSANKTIKYITSNYTVGTRYIEVDTFMVYEGTDRTSTYEPYHSQTVAFPLGDKVLMQGSKLTDYGFYDDRGQMVLDGSQVMTGNVSGNYIATYQSVINLKPAFSNSQIANIKANCFIAITRDEWENSTIKKEGIGVSESGLLLLKILTSRLNGATVNDFKTWLSTHPTTVEYELATPTITPYTPEQQTAYNQLKALLLHTGTNIITTDGNLPPNMKIEYKQDGLKVVREEM